MLEGSQFDALLWLVEDGGSQMAYPVTITVAALLIFAAIVNIADANDVNIRNREKTLFCLKPTDLPIAETLVATRHSLNDVMNATSCSMLAAGVVAAIQSIDHQLVKIRLPNSDTDIYVDGNFGKWVSQ
jgi:hypothetical protein